MLKSIKKAFLSFTNNDYNFSDKEIANLMENARIASNERRDLHEQYTFLTEILKKEGSSIIGVETITHGHCSDDFIVTNLIDEDELKIELINISYPLMNKNPPSLEYSFEKNCNSNNKELSYRAKMKCIFVKKEDRRKGIGSALIKHFKIFINDMSMIYGSKITHISGSLPRDSSEREVSELKDFYIKNGFEYTPSNDGKTNGYIRYTFDI